MTLMPRSGWKARAAVQDKGRVRVGADADITVFDANRVIDKATYEKPLQYSEGISLCLSWSSASKDGRLLLRRFPGRAARAPVSQ